MSKFEIYDNGLVYCSVCSDLPLEEITAKVNGENPTGISNPWKLSNKGFADGTKNPRICENDPGCKHYLFVC